MRTSAWYAHRPASKMGEKIRNLAAELQLVQQELYAELAFPDGTPRKSSLGADLHSNDDLGVLRSAVDQFRRVLWFYIDQTQAEADQGQRKPAQSERSATARSANTAELAAQRSRSAQPDMQPVSFFDRLDMVIEGYLQAGQLSSYRKPPKA